MSLETIEPKNVWRHFASINTIPRASKKEEKIIQFILDFGKSLSLDTQRDQTGNVVIRKPATEGFEHKEIIVLQAHLDMVHQKNNDTSFDFEKEGIQMYIDDDWVKARGTTLGADNGLGVACMMTLLASNDIPHPAIEALFTVDEETGMTGAKGLSSDLLTGHYMINLDTEQDNEITIGCAGGIDVTASGSYALRTLSNNHGAAQISIKGLRGGHSGIDIDKGLGNANKLLTRILYTLNESKLISLQNINGGGLRNAIPREASATIAFHTKDTDNVKEIVKNIIADIINEYYIIEPNIDIQLSPIDVLSNEVIEPIDQTRILNMLMAVHNGIYRMSPNIETLVETSNNVARVTVENGSYQILCLTRSSVESSKLNLANALKATFELAGAEVIFSGDYPGWVPAPQGTLVKIIEENYRMLFHEEPHLIACHAGLECGLIGKKYPEMEMISIGPTILGAHSPEERASISSLQKFWQVFQSILQQTP